MSALVVIGILLALGTAAILVGLMGLESVDYDIFADDEDES